MKKIKEFDMDIPYSMFAPNSIEWRRRRREFWDITRCVVALVEKCMIPIPNEKHWKIIVNCVDLPYFTDDIVKGSRGDTPRIDVSFDYHAFLSLSEEQQKEATLGLLISGVTEALRQLDIESSSFIDACNKAQSLSLENTWTHRKARYLRTSYFAEVKCIHEINHFYIYLIIWNKNTEVERKLVADVAPDEWKFKPMLGEVKWLSNCEVALFSRNKAKVITTVVQPIDGS